MIYLIVLVLISTAILLDCKIHVALHAQVFPELNDKVVGSVMTTSGILAALVKRPEIASCSIFYPFYYDDFFEKNWSLVIIEGWYPTIHNFIQLTRNNFPKAYILYYCLDPSYPNLNIVTSLDVDGYLTNSIILNEYFEKELLYPSQLTLLGADPDVMRPIKNTTRNYGAVYVGAGGNMVHHKKRLLEMLENVKSYGLLLYGSSWDEVPSMKDIWKGLLPLKMLAEAYSTGHVVIASTIDSQSKYGMINNRIFEALACGSVIVTDYSESLHNLVGDDIIYFTYNHTDIKLLMDYVLSHPEEAESRRQHARELILNHHTWDHRAVQIMDFYHYIASSPVGSLTAAQTGVPLHQRGHAPTMAVVVSDHLSQHPDYLHLLREGGLQAFFQSRYTVQVLSEATWRAMGIGDDSAAGTGVMSRKRFDVLLLVATPFDALEMQFKQLIRSIATELHGENEKQKVCLFMLGFRQSLAEDAKTQFLRDPAASEVCRSSVCGESGEGVFADSFLGYDLILYRDAYELQLLGNSGVNLVAGRLQHVFGAGEGPVESLGEGVGYELVVCFGHSMELCDWGAQRVVGSGQRLLLLGGDWDEWLWRVPLQPHQLRYTSHCRRGGALVLFQEASSVLLCQAAGDNADTVNDVLWPLVAAVATGLPVRLLQHNAHLLASADQCGGWSTASLQQALQTAANRLYGLASATAGLRVTILPADALSVSLLEDSPGPVAGGLAAVAVGIELMGFQPGRDGRLCVQQGGVNTICFITTVRQLVIQPVCVDGDTAVEIVLLGTLYDDYPTATARIQLPLRPISSTVAAACPALAGAACYGVTLRACVDQPVN